MMMFFVVCSKQSVSVLVSGSYRYSHVWCVCSETVLRIYSNIRVYYLATYLITYKSNYLPNDISAI